MVFSFAANSSGVLKPAPHVTDEFGVSVLGVFRVLGFSGCRVEGF